MVKAFKCQQLVWILTLVCSFNPGPSIQESTSGWTDPSSKRRQHRLYSSFVRSSRSISRSNNSSTHSTEKRRAPSSWKNLKRPKSEQACSRTTCRSWRRCIRSPSGRDDADPTPRHHFVLARPRKPRASSSRLRATRKIFHAPQELPRLNLPSCNLTTSLPEAAPQVNRHQKSQRGPLADPSEGQPRSNTTSDEGSPWPQLLTLKSVVTFWNRWN